MNILVVDDEENALLEMKQLLHEINEAYQVTCFLFAQQALEYAQKHDIDIVFVDIEMRLMNGLELAKKLKELQPYVNLIFVTGYSQYAVNAFALRSSGYLLKPACKEEILIELQNLKMPVEEKSDIKVQTFGSFEVIVHDKAVEFPRAKSKEILAYLVDRKGASVTMGELAGVLWEDKPFTTSQKSYLRTLISELLNTLKEYQIEQIVIKTHNSIAVDVAKISCDYYDFLHMKVSAINAFRGIYMADYGWAEFTLGSLNHLSEKR